MSEQRVLAFSKQASDPKFYGTVKTEDLLSELSGQSDEAVKKLGSDWQITSAATTVSHFMAGQLPSVEYVLTVVLAKSAS